MAVNRLSLRISVLLCQYLNQCRGCPRIDTNDLTRDFFGLSVGIFAEQQLAEATKTLNQSRVLLVEKLALHRQPLPQEWPGFRL